MTFLEETTRTKLLVTKKKVETQKHVMSRENTSPCPTVNGLPNMYKPGTLLIPIVIFIGLDVISRDE